MHPDPLSAFLRTKEWAQHLGGRFDDSGNIFTKHHLPGIGHYWRSTRCWIPEDWKLPDFAKDGWFVRLQPDSTESYDNLKKQHLKLAGAAAIQPRQTLYLDLHQTEAELLANLHGKHRYNLRIAQKKEIQVEILTTNLEQEMSRLWQLLSNTANRHSFRTHPKAYYYSIIKALEPAGMVRLAFAKYQGRDVAGLMLITYQGIATYLHGGSSYEDRALKAPNLLQWSVIQALNQEGFSIYDLWGVHTVDGEAVRGHFSEGTTRFKIGFGGILKDYPPTADMILKPFCYTLYKGLHGLQSQKRSFSQ